MYKPGLALTYKCHKGHLNQTKQNKTCHGWTWIFKTRYHVRCFSASYFLECCFLRVLLYVHLRTFFKFFKFICYLSIQHFCYVLFVSIFYFKIGVFLLFLVHLSLCILHRLLGWIFFRYFESPVLFAAFSLSPDIFWFISSICFVSLICCCPFIPLDSCAIYLPQ